MIKISWCNKKIGLRDTKLYGNGVFVNKDIQKGERVVVFGGYVVSFSELKKTREINKKTADLIFKIGYQVDDDLIFSPTTAGQFSIAEYINHSCDPTCGFENQLDLVALRSLKKGEEITIDYATCMSHPTFKLECLCGSKKCRKYITGNDWKNPLLQKKYKGHFQPYLEDKIEALNKKKK